MSGENSLCIRYYSHVQSEEVDNEKLPILVQYLDEVFRRTVICEVRGGHELTGSDYGPLVARCLKRRGIERDVDIDYQTFARFTGTISPKTTEKQQKFMRDKSTFCA